jgi:hypothetical protein
MAGRKDCDAAPRTDKWIRVSTVTQFKKSFSPEKPQKPGLLKRFLCWIAKGADKPNMGKALCPT